MLILLYAAVFLGISVMFCFEPYEFTRYFRVDQLNRLFLIILAVIFSGVALYNLGSMKGMKGMKGAEEPGRSHSFYSMNILLFVASMIGVILSTHLALLWVFVEASTLSSSYLIYYSRTKSSLEATWKYLFICSIGIAIAFVGIIFLSMGLGNLDSLFFDDLQKNAALINPFWLKLAYPFMLVGFGTKVGFGPVHSWLPDAHSESPSPISALLSGTLLNTALLGIIRINRVMDAARMGWYTQMLLLVIGFISIFIAAVYIVNIRNYKRMLAYSSIENMGIIAIGLGLGGAGIFAALLHTAAHSLTKASLFLTSGNILKVYETKYIGEVKGLLKKDSLSGWLWIFSFAGIVGLPPFPIFLSEFLIIRSMFEGGRVWLAVIFFLLLTVIIAGIGRAVFYMTGGIREGDDISLRAKGLGFYSYAPQIIFLAILILMGVSMPDFIYNLIQSAVQFMGV